MIISHTPVLLPVILKFIPSSTDNSIVVDATLGEGGHSFAFLKEGYAVFGIDRDIRIQEKAKERLSGFPAMHYALCTYDKIADAIPERHHGNIRFVLFDLGVSRYHFKEAARGFSFAEDSPLDMRLSADASLSAYDVVNEYSEDELTRVFKEYGEMHYAARIARAIADARRNAPVATTKELENIVFHATPKNLRHGKTHPATRAFQALRIEVNDELTILSNALEATLPLLKEGGRIATIAYHSLEDRICKRFFRAHDERNGDGTLIVLTKSVITPSEEEVQTNPAARSAKMRVAERRTNHARATHH